MEVKKKDNVFCIEQTESRNIEVGKFAFMLNEAGLPEDVDLSLLEKKADTRVEAMKANFVTILNGKSLSYTELGKEYMSITKFKKDTANAHIREACEKKIIEKDENEKYKLCEVAV